MASKSSYVICKHIADLAKERVEIHGQGICIESEGVEEVRINATFFQKDTCYGCGLCCTNYDTCFFPNELEYISSVERLIEFDEKNLPIENQHKLFDLLEKQTILVNGVEHQLYVVPPLKPKEIDLYLRANRPACRWIIPRETGEMHCGIHPIRSITCGLPHMNIIRASRGSSDNTVISHRQFGRNHQLGCKVPIGSSHPQEFDKQTFDTNIYWLTRLKEAADSIGVQTWLPEVIDYLLSHEHDFEEGKFPKFLGDSKYEYISICKSSQKKLF